MATAPALSDRLAEVEDPGEAISLVLERALDESELDHGIVVFREGDRYRAVGLGQSDGLLRALREHATDEGSSLGQALRQGERTRLPSPQGDGELLVLPLGSAEPWAAILLDAEAPQHPVDALANTFRRYRTFLERTHVAVELRERQHRLVRERDLLSTIVDRLPDPVVVTNPGNEILFANYRADELFSAGSGDSEGRRRAVQLNTLLFSSFLTQSAISAGRSETREINLVDPADGTDLLFEVLPTPLPEAHADGGYLSILRNITDLEQAVTELEAQARRSRAAERRVREEWERLNATLENVGDPILVTDGQSNIILMNREAERLFEVPADAPEGARRGNAVRANDTKLTSLMSEFLLQPQNRRVHQFELHDPDGGSDRPVEVVSSKILDERGEPQAIVSVVHDLTQVVENRRLAEELRHLNEQLEDRIRLATVELEERNRRLEWQSRELEKASRLKSEFLASMSHELRTPINAVLGYASLMRDEIYGQLTDQQRNGLDKVNSASKHLLDLVNDILDLSKIEAGKMPIHLEEVSARQVVGELAEAVAPLALEKDIDLDVDAADDLPPMFTDRTKLKQILLNLLSNAVKFTSEGGVTVRIEQNGEERVRVSVSDTGVGIRPEDLDTIFDEFRQVDQSRTREQGGTGLGLSITRKLVVLLDGDIEVDSTYGEGTTFRVDLPRRLSPRRQRDQVKRAVEGATADLDGDAEPAQ